MKDNTVRFLLVANLVAMLLVLGTQVLRPAPAVAQARVKWEYSWVQYKSDEVADQATKQGQNGWEAFSVTTQMERGYELSRVWLKRRKN